MHLLLSISFLVPSAKDEELVHAPARGSGEQHISLFRFFSSLMAPPHRHSMVTMPIYAYPDLSCQSEFSRIRCFVSRIPPSGSVSQLYAAWLQSARVPPHFRTRPFSYEQRFFSRILSVRREPTSLFHLVYPRWRVSSSAFRAGVSSRR